MKRINIREILGKVQHPLPINKQLYIYRHTDIGELPNTDVVVEGCLLVVVYQGCVIITIEGQPFTLSRGDIFACRPQHIFKQSRISPDFEAWSLFGTPAFAEEIAQLVHLNWSLSFMLSTHEIVHVHEERLPLLLATLQLMHDKQCARPMPNQANSMKMLLASLIYDMFDSRQRNQSPVPMQSYTSAEHLFHRFIKSLNDSRQPFRNVTLYAQELCVSPKYLSAICKQLSGQTASELIHQAVIRKAQILLLDSPLSIKEIAEKLDFTNQSHFGVFFRRHTGLSPLEYRKRQH